MKLKLIIAAGLVAAASGANAQVVDTAAIVAPFDGATAKFLSIGENIADINGSVTVDVGGSNGFDLEVAAALAGLPAGVALEINSLPTTATFGNIATVAAGAISDTTTDLDQAASEVASHASASTSNTASAASDIASAGSAIGVSTGAFNSGLINGSVLVSVAAGNTAFGGISTTAAGAINTADLTAKFVAP